MELPGISLALKSFFEAPYALICNFMVESGFSSPAPKLGYTITVLLVVVATQRYFIWRTKLPFPVAGLGINSNNMRAMEEAKSKYPNQPFIIPGEPSIVVLPNSMLDEVKNLPDDQISFRAATYEHMLGRYTSIGTPHPNVIESIRLDLTRNISKTFGDLQDEAAFAVDTEFVVSNTWTGVKVCGKLVKAVARTSARVFVGLPLCRDEEWLQTTIKYTEDVVNARQKISKYPFLVRPLVAPFLAECRRLRVDRQRAGKMLAPTIATIIESRSTGPNDCNREEDDAPLDSNGQYNLASWIMGRYKTNEKPRAELVGEEQLLVSFAAIQTTSLTTTQALFDLASYPECAAELRAEINEVAARSPDGKLTRDSMAELRKLDSFLKESQRLHPLAMVVMQRLVTAKNGLTLSPSVHLPRGTFVCFAHPPSQPSASLPQPPLDEFYPFRYAELRAIPGEEHKHQFVTTALDSLHFGHGPNACAGRFFAGTLIKVLMIELIRRYDIALSPKGEGAGGEVNRPPTLTVGTSFIPNPRADIYFRQR